MANTYHPQHAWSVQTYYGPCRGRHCAHTDDCYPVYLINAPKADPLAGFTYTGFTVSG